MEVYNLYAAWTGILLGFVSGTVSGLFFYRNDWLGGYDAWPRRIMRLGHISFFGLAFINLAFVFTVRHLEVEEVSSISSILLILGAIAMPVVCYASTIAKSARHLFFIPVASLILGTTWFIIGDLLK